MIHDTAQIHGFAKRIHVFTNLLYESRNLTFNILVHMFRRKSGMQKKLKYFSKVGVINNQSKINASSKYSEIYLYGMLRRYFSKK
jgi:hypothetical protein